MVGAQGPFDYITMGGLFTLFKVREAITTYDDPGWYQHPPGTVATLASAEELNRDGIEISAPSAVAKYVCPMHAEVVSDKPGECPKCKMKLVQKPKAGTSSGHQHH